MPDERDRNDAGQFTKTRSPEDMFEAMDPLEPYTTGELADALGWPRRTTYQALSELADEERIRKKTPEPRRAIWIRPPDGEST